MSPLDLSERAAKYLESLRRALATIEVLDEHARKVVGMAARYLSDAEYYFERGDCATSIACSSYAEGLLDSLNILQIARVEWPREGRPRVLVGGTFEILHPGHLHLLRRAWELGRVVVIVARDSTFERLKGRLPVVSERQRLEVVKVIRYVDEAYLGSDPIDIEGTLQKLKPDYVLLGPDQNFIESMVLEAVARSGLNVRVVRLKERVCEAEYITSTTEIIKRASTSLSASR